MIFNPNVPNLTDTLNVSQPILRANNQELDSVYGADHYKFSDGTSNKGKHNKVTTPIYIENPPTNLPPATTTDPIMYAFQVPSPPTTSNIGPMHFSRGTNNAIPTPITKLQSLPADSTFTAGEIKDIVDLTGVNIAIGTLRSDAIDDILARGTQIHPFFYTPTKNKVRLLQNTAALPVTINLLIASNKLQIQSTIAQSNVYWTVEFSRLD